jgi:hypothetical protein
MKCQGEKPNLKISKSGQSANYLISSAPIVTITANGGGCVFGREIETSSLSHATPKRKYEKVRLSAKPPD